MEFQDREDRIPARTAPRARHRRSQEHDADARERLAAHAGQEPAPRRSDRPQRLADRRAQEPERHEGGITLGAKNLYELIANAPGDEITLKRADNHWAEIRSGKVTYRIVGMPDRDFPKVPDHREATYTTIESAVLREMIDRTLFSVCNDETRFHLNGVYFESDGTKARMVSTDGHRLSKVERTIANGPKLSAGVIIPKKGLLEMKKVLESGPSCKLAIKTPHLFLVAGGHRDRGEAHRRAVPAVRAGHPEGPQEDHHGRPRRASSIRCGVRS